MENAQIIEILKYVWPIIVLQLGFQIYAIFDLIKIRQKKTKNLSALIWGLIIVFGEILGAALYFILGRSEE